MTFFIRLSAALVVLGGIATTASAASAPTFDVTVQNDVIVDTVTRADVGGTRAHLNFPYMKQHANGDLVVSYAIGQTQSPNQAGRQAISTDGGLTWTQRVSVSGDRAPAHLIRPSGQFSRGFGVNPSNPAGFTSWGNNGRHNSINGGITWDSGSQAINYDTNGVSYTVMGSSFGDVVANGTNLYMPLFGTRLGASTSETVLMVSSDDGLNWSRRSTIAQHTTSLNNGAMGSEGPTESSIVRLDNGNLLSVYRTGQPFPNTNVNATEPALFWSMSTDDGFNWTTAKSLGVAGVFPLLRKLDDGNVALTYGRYGAKVMLADETGLRWSMPTTLHNGPTSGHTEMRSIGGGQYAYIYDESGFYPPSWNGAVPAGFVYDNDDSARLHSLRLNIQRQNVADPYNWNVEYQGGVTPDATVDPWQTTITGSSVSGRLWADQGQDYLHMDSGGNFQPRTYFYEMDNSAAVWSIQDFANGIALETRVKVSGSTNVEGGAVIRLGDGINGEVTLEFTNTAVNLQGVAQTTALVDMTQWHEFRLIIETSDLTGLVTASLFLDGNFTNPILTQLLNPTAYDGILFGDPDAGVPNALFDVDYLRFASIPEPGTAGLLIAFGVAMLGTRQQLRRPTTAGHVEARG